MDNKRRLTINVDEDLVKKLKLLAVNTNKTAGYHVEKALYEYLLRKEQKTKKE